MKIGFHGAARSVTGSRHLIETSRARVLLDCGLFQGRRQESDQLNRTLTFEASSLDAVVISHAHIDHIGNLPTLPGQGFRGPIFATEPTCDLAGIMLRDSAHIQEKDAEFVNKRRRRHHGRHIEPLYTQEDVERVIPRLRSVHLHKWREVADGFRVRFRDAGHILGSASVEVEVAENGTRRRVVFSGDIGSSNRVIIRDPEPAPGCDVLIMESTYGDRLHEASGDIGKHLARIIRRVTDRGGRTIIPAFSLGRTQHVVYHLGQAIRSGSIPKIPIYVDSPLAVNATEIYRRHPDWYDSDARAALEDSGDPLSFEQVTYIRDVEESKELNERRESCVIISASGMCEAGRILHHLRNNIGDPRNAVVLVGFQAEHTLGRRLEEQRSVVNIFGEPFERRAEVHALHGMSAHADRDQLLAWAGAIEGRPARSFLVHGELPAQEALAARLSGLGFDRVAIPTRGEEVTIG